MATPSIAPIPKFINPVSVLPDKLVSLPIVLDFSPLVLVVLTMLVGVFIAGLSVILLYHWRRFPFEHETFRTAEHIYMTGTFLLFAVAVVGILIS